MESSLIAKKLHRLKMPGMMAMLEQRFDQAMQEKWSYSTLVEMLLTDEIERRDHKQLTLRLAKSRLDQSKTMETFDFTFNAKIQAPLIRELSSCAFIKKTEHFHSRT